MCRVRLADRPRFSSGKVYLGRLSRSISRRVSSGVRARVMSLDSPPNGIAFPFTSPFICWSMVCVGMLGLSETAAFGGGAFPSALSSARALWTAPSRAWPTQRLQLVSSRLSYEDERGRVRVPGWHSDHEPKEKGCGGLWDGSPKYGVNQRRERGGAAGGCPNNPMLYRSFRSKASHRSERGPAPNWRCACPTFTNTSGGDANSGSDGDAGSGHTRKRGAHSATRLAVWHRLPVGQSCLYSGVGLDRNSADFAPLRPNWRSRVRRDQNKLT